MAAARRHLTKAIELNPDSGFVHASLGAAMMQTGSTAEAVDAYRKATSLEPSEAGLRLSLATALNRAGQRDDALQEAKLALALARTEQQKLAAQSLIDRLSKGEMTR
jgi:Flp pilus assembly protein TadD